MGARWEYIGAVMAIMEQARGSDERGRDGWKSENRRYYLPG
jgi:hypothetical protein